MKGGEHGPCRDLRSDAGSNERDVQGHEKFGDGPTPDAVLAGDAQVIVHHEIADYGMLKICVSTRYKDVAKLRREMLQEEKTDELLTQIAGVINV
ncbi:DUF892 family protein [Methylobacterium tarhaniae]|uniref:DUF892 family protein n=1 Tax=Methylobacterium tarhaniae TaxID=1187852 RepID=UPI003CFF7A50